MSASKKRKIDSENREFQELWEVDYLFILNKGNPQCLECLQTVATTNQCMKKSIIRARETRE